MANAGTNNEDAENRMKAATSIDSLDNCSTVSSGDQSAQVKTLFVSGLPMDTKPRELYLLFRAYQGFESSQLKVTNKNGKPSPPVGFVTFATRHDADEAKRKLSGVYFDPDIKQPIRLEFARTNTKVNKPKQQSPPVYNPTSLPGITPNPLDSAAFMTATSMYDQLHVLEQQQLLAANGMLNLPLQGLPLLSGNLQTNQLVAATMAASALQQQQLLAANLNLMSSSTSSSGTNPPCSTLFVANLGSNPDEEELRNLFRRVPGFCRLRINNKSGAPVAFVEYADVRQASYALATLQGSALASSERGSGIRIEYAKTKMGEGSTTQQQQQSAQYY